MTLFVETISEGLEIKNKVCIYVFSQQADLSLPLGTVLGNIGINFPKFHKEFNASTSELPSYFKVKTLIYIYEDRSYKMFFFLPSTGFILNLLKFDKEVELLGGLGRNIVIKDVISCVLLLDVVKLSKFKFPDMDLTKSFNIIRGSVFSMDLTIINT